MYEIHPLEQRCLLTANLQNGTLDITSSFFEDNYTITMDGTNITVVILAEGFNAQYPRTGPDRVQRINLHEPLEPANPQGLGSTITVTDPVSVGNHALGIPITIAASNHDDFISITGSGDASINGLDGADTIVGGEGNDTIQGGDGRTENNQQGVSEGDDILYGGAGDDQLFGQGGGGGGNMRIGDILMGQAGNDTLEGGAGRDLLDGGTGTNFISYADHTTDVELEFPSLAGAFNPANPLAFDNYPTQGIGTFNNQGQQEHDQIYNDLDTFGFGLGPYNPLEDWHTEFYTQSLANALGDGGFQGILGGNSNSPPGDDIIDVSLSTGISWTIFGNDGQDEILGSSQADSIDGGNQEDDIFGGGGADTIHGGAANDFIVGDDIANSTISNDQMFGDAGNDTVWGGLGNDTLDGGTGNDLLVGDIGGGNTDTNPGSGNDVLIGGDAATDGQGADTLQGDGGMDTADYTARTSPIKITFDTVHDDGAAGEGDFVTESTEIGLGGSGNDTLDGRFTSNVGRVLNGQGGNDTLVSGQGPDTIIGGTGTDSVDYRARTNPIVVTFDGLANDGDPLLNNGGPAGENDNVDNTVELVLTKDNPTGGGGNNGGGGGGGGGGATTAPLAPSALGPFSLTYKSAVLRWKDNSNNEDGFTIVRRLPTDKSYTTVGTVGRNVTKFTDTGLLPGGTYIYRVKATNTVGDSPFSNFTKIVTPSAAVFAPIKLSARPISASRIDLNWQDKSNNETGFQVWRQVAGGAFSKIADVAAGVTAFSDTGLTADTQYGYKVRGVNEFRVSTFSKVATATTMPVNFVAAPSGLTVTVVGNGVNKLSWTDNSDNETGFSIERLDAGDPNGLFTPISDVGANATSFNDVTAGNTVWVYRVLAFNPTDHSDYSNLASNSVAKALAAPTRFEVQAFGPDKELLTWRDDSLIETGFQIWRAVNPNDDFTLIATTKANATSFKDTGLIAHTNYRYEIRATDGVHFSKFTRVANDTTLNELQTLPSPPSALKVSTFGSSSIKLTWRDNSTDNTLFQIERATSLDGPFTAVDTVGPDTTSYTDKGLTSGTTFYYRVRGRDGTIRSTPTAIVSGTTA